MSPQLLVYYFNLADTTPEALQRLAGERLPDAEQAVAERYRQLNRRCQYLAGRLLLRGVLAQRLDQSARAFQFEIGDHGKPALVGGPAFNLAHTEHYVALAVSDSGAVGIDIEILERRIKPLDLAAMVLHPQEFNELQVLAPAAQRDYFLRLWSAKEAYVKALGRGLAYGLPKVRVDFAAGRVTGPEHVAALATMTAPPGHVGALICLGAEPAPTTQLRVIELDPLCAESVTHAWADQLGEP